MTFDDTLVNYSASLLERDASDRNHIVRELRLLKERHDVRGRQVAELGCGFGDNLLVFADDNEVIGVEGLADAVTEARRRGINVVQANLDVALPIAENSVDWVLCIDVLEHLVSPFGLLQRIRGCLRSGGKLVVNVPNHFDIKGRLRILAGSGLDVHKFFPSSNDWDNPHIRFFTRRGINLMLERAGFQVVEDLSATHSTVRVLNRMRGRAAVVSRVLIKRAPGLLAGGFFLVAEAGHK